MLSMQQNPLALSFTIIQPMDTILSLLLSHPGTDCCFFSWTCMAVHLSQGTPLSALQHIFSFAQLNKFALLAMHSTFWQ